MHVIVRWTCTYNFLVHQASAVKLKFYRLWCTKCNLLQSHGHSSRTGSSPWLNTRVKNRPGCLFIRTFFTEEFIYPLTYNAWNCMHPPFNKFDMWDQDTRLDFMEISSYPCNWICIYNKCINYALWHTFESKRYMYFHNKTWYTCTRCYM